MTYRFFVLIFLGAALLPLGLAGSEARGEGLAGDEDCCCCPDDSQFSGSLSITGGGLVGKGDWAGSYSTKISWTVTDMDTYYHYVYTLNVPKKDISHFIIGVSDNFEMENLEHETGFAFGDWWSWTPSTEIGDYTSKNGNPDMPGPLHGLKFDELHGTTLTISFDSDRVPVWGDFYAKGGKGSRMWNEGFLDENPLDPPRNGSCGNHILVPDSQSHPDPIEVPEPTTLTLLLMALVGAVVAIRRHR